MAFNIRKYLGIDGTPGAINHNNTAYPIPDSLLDQIDSNINQLVEIVALARANKPPTNAAEFKQSLDRFVNSTGLEEFFPPGHPLLAQISVAAEALLHDPTAILNAPEQLEVRSQGALYDVVLYCDDSRSMRESGADRVPVQQDFASRLCDIITPLDPNGVTLTFINNTTVFSNLKTGSEVARIIGRIPYTGFTPIGTMMQSKILEPMVFQKIRDGTLKKPLLVIVITDGWPYDETEDHFRNVIQKGMKDLASARKSRRSIIYQINQICIEPKAASFIQGLHDDKTIQKVVYITSDMLDGQIAKLKENKQGLNEWLFDLLKTTVQNPNA